MTSMFDLSVALVANLFCDELVFADEDDKDDEGATFKSVVAESSSSKKPKVKAEPMFGSSLLESTQSYIMTAGSDEESQLELELWVPSRVIIVCLTLGAAGTAATDDLAMSAYDILLDMGSAGADAADDDGRQSSSSSS